MEEKAATGSNRVNEDRSCIVEYGNPTAKQPQNIFVTPIVFFKIYCILVLFFIQLKVNLVRPLLMGCWIRLPHDNEFPPSPPVQVLRVDRNEADTIGYHFSLSWTSWHVKLDVLSLNLIIQPTAICSMLGTIAHKWMAVLFMSVNQFKIPVHFPYFTLVKYLNAFRGKDRSVLDYCDLEYASNRVFLFRPSSASRTTFQKMQRWRPFLTTCPALTSKKLSSRQQPLRLCNSKLDHSISSSKWVLFSDIILEFRNAPLSLVKLSRKMSILKGQ